MAGTGHYFCLPLAFVPCSGLLRESLPKLKLALVSPRKNDLAFLILCQLPSQCFWVCVITSVGLSFLRR